MVTSHIFWVKNENWFTGPFECDLSFSNIFRIWRLLWNKSNGLSVLFPFFKKNYISSCSIIFPNISAWILLYFKWSLCEQIEGTLYTSLLAILFSTLFLNKSLPSDSSECQDELKTKQKWGKKMWVTLICMAHIKNFNYKIHMNFVLQKEVFLKMH